MATHNFFALLSDNELDDPWTVITPVSASEKPASVTATAKKTSAPSATQQPKLPSKPLSPAEAVRASRNFENGGRGRGERARGGGGRYDDRNYSGRDGRPEGFNVDGLNSSSRNQRQNVDFINANVGDTNFVQGSKSGNYGGGRGNAYGGPSKSFNGNNGDAMEIGPGWPRGRGRGRGYGDGIRKQEPRHSEAKGTGNDNDIVKSEPSEEQHGKPVEEEEKKAANPVEDHKHLKVESPDNVALIDGEGEIKKAEEDNEMTLDEYEKILDEKRKALTALKHVERKVDTDKAFGSMQLRDKKTDDDVFIKLGFEKEKSRKKEATDKEEKPRKPVSINEFLKPVDGETYQKSFSSRGRGRGSRGSDRSNFAANFGTYTGLPVPSIEDPAQFPTLRGN